MSGRDHDVATVVPPAASPVHCQAKAGAALQAPGNACHRGKDPVLQRGDPGGGEEISEGERSACVLICQAPL